MMFTGQPHSSTILAMTGSKEERPLKMSRYMCSPGSFCRASGRTSRRAASVCGWKKTSSTSPCSSMTPRLMMATWLHIFSMTLISWVMTTAVMPSWALMSLMRARMESVVAGSRAEVASSQRSTRGLVARARAMATRCFCPPESCDGYDSMRLARPTRSSSSSARLRASARGVPTSSSGKQTFCSAVRCMSRLNCWKIMPMERRAARSSASGSRQRSLPSKITLPPVGRSSMLMQRTSVDLPAPLCPMMPKISPLPIARSMPRRA